MLRDHYKSLWALWLAEKYEHKDPSYFISCADIKATNGINQQ
jgi:hypothetical protein